MAGTTSVTNGSVSVPYPSDFTADFEKLRLNCLGDLAKAAVPEDAEDLLLSYWLADFSPRAISFVRAAGATCLPGTGFLSIASRVDTPLAEEPLFANLTFWPDGELVNKDDSSNPVNKIPPEVDSRLQAPNQFSVIGPVKNQGNDGSDGEEVESNEIYTVVPCANPYFNDYLDSATDQRSVGDGFIAVAGHADVTYFEDLAVHIHLDAKPSSELSTVYMMGGWREGSDSFFNLPTFDPRNRGRPAAIYLEGYREADERDEGYLARAKKDVLDLFELDEAVIWNPSTRSFRSIPKGLPEWIVLTGVSTEVLYLSAEQAEFSVGLRYQGLPRINLANLLFNAIDDEYGLFNAIFEAGGKLFIQAFANGEEHFKMLNGDYPVELFLPLLRNSTSIESIPAESPIGRMRSIYSDLGGAVDAQGKMTRSALEQLVEDRLVGSFGPTGTVKEALLKIENPVSPDTENSIPHAVEYHLALIEGSLRAFGDRLAIKTATLTEPDQIYYYPDPGFNYDSPPAGFHVYDGFLKPDGEGNYASLSALVRQLIRQITLLIAKESKPVVSYLQNLPEIGNVIAAIDGLSNLDKQITKQFGRAANPLASIAQSLLQLREEITAMRADLLDPTGEFHQDLDALYRDFRLNEVDTMLASVKARAVNQIESMLNDGGYYAHAEADFQKVLDRILLDAVMESQMVEDFQVAVRQRLYDRERDFRLHVDNAFAIANRALRGLLNDALRKADDKLYNAAGNFDRLLGTGQMTGYAHITNDSLRRLRIDLKAAIDITYKMSFEGFLEVNQYDSTGSESCSLLHSGDTPLTVTEVKLGALGVEIGGIGKSKFKGDITTKFTFLRETGEDFPIPVNLMGSLVLKDGKMGYKKVTVKKMGAALALGLQENYISAYVHELDIAGTTLAGGIFLGHACSAEPLQAIDPKINEVLGLPPYGGFYARGEGAYPLLNLGCWLRIKIGGAISVWALPLGENFGGSIEGYVSGRVLCIVNAKGKVFAYGGLADGDPIFRGGFAVSGKILFVEFEEEWPATYKDGEWEHDF